MAVRGVFPGFEDGGLGPDRRPSAAPFGGPVSIKADAPYSQCRRGVQWTCAGGDHSGGGGLKREELVQVEFTEKRVNVWMMQQPPGKGISFISGACESDTDSGFREAQCECGKSFRRPVPRTSMRPGMQEHRLLSQRGQGRKDLFVRLWSLEIGRTAKLRCGFDTERHEEPQSMPGFVPTGVFPAIPVQVRKTAQSVPSPCGSNANGNAGGAGRFHHWSIGIPQNDGIPIAHSQDPAA